MISQSNRRSKLPLLIVGTIIVLAVVIALGTHNKTQPKISMDIKKPMPMNGEKYNSF